MTFESTTHLFPRGASGEFNKNMRTMESLVDAFDTFGLIRKEPVLGVPSS